MGKDIISVSACGISPHSQHLCKVPHCMEQNTRANTYLGCRTGFGRAQETGAVAMTTRSIADTERPTPTQARPHPLVHITRRSFLPMPEVLYSLWLWYESGKEKHLPILELID